MIPTLRTHSSGFTLAELSIVLVVIGLIVGGIFVGTSLIRNAELRVVVSDANRFRQAAKLFLDKYKYLPGDFPRAEEFWGSLAGCPETEMSDERTKKTCSGTGDGFIGGIQPTPSSPTAINGSAQEIGEVVRVWQHLANAGLIEGSYSGTGATWASNALMPGLNIPRGALTNSGFTLHFASSYLNNLGAYQADYKHIIVFGCATCPKPLIMGVGGDQYLTIANPVTIPILTTDEAFTIDAKMDDGKPGSGNVLSYTPNLINTRNCATSAVASTAVYKTAYKAPACSLIFITGL